MQSVVAAAALAVVLSVAASSTRAETVDLALVFAADVSRSVDDDEFKLQRQGYAAAVTDPATNQTVVDQGPPPPGFAPPTPVGRKYRSKVDPEGL